MGSRARLVAVVILSVLTFFTLTACSRSAAPVAGTPATGTVAPPPGATGAAAVPAAAPAPVAAAPAPAPAPAASRPRAQRHSSRMAESQPAPAPQPAAAPQPPPPPPDVVIPAKTVLEVRLNGAIGSDTNQVGDSFTGVLSQPVVENGKVIVPRNARVTGTVVTATSAGHIKGRSELGLRLASVSYNGYSYDLVASWSKLGPSRGARSAKVIGGGGGLGALIGALAGKGKGAAIGAAVGAGAGTAVQAMTKPAPVHEAAETVLQFPLAQAIRVQPAASLLN